MNRLLVLTGCLCFFAPAAVPQKSKFPPANQQDRAIALKSQAAGCSPGNSVTELSLNNARTWVRPDGSLWSRPAMDETGPGYEIPKNSGKSSIYSGGLAIGGKDINGQLKVSACLYSGSRSYWPGPLMAEGPSAGRTNPEACYRYDQLFISTRSEVESFRDWFQTPPGEREKQFPGYTIPGFILDWPAHGDVAAGYEHLLAPFWDQDNNGLYDPAAGDYPFYDLEGTLACGATRESNKTVLHGDSNVWWVINDKGNKPGWPLDGPTIGIEVQAQAFQFVSHDALNDMSFYHFKLINRTTFTLYETYAGIVADGDIGYPFDDFAGCDVGRGIGYFYNGNPVDGSGEPNSYGNNPPAIGFDFIEGPYKDANGQDDCSSYDEHNNLICNGCILNGNINGLNFADGIIDNERLGMSGLFVVPSTGGVGYSPFPNSASCYYYMTGNWRDGTPLRYGDTGQFPFSQQGEGPECVFMFPGTSDPCGWGLGGLPQPAWSAITSGMNPYTPIMVQSSGPFTLEPGGINDFTIGVVWARSYNGDLTASVDKMLIADEKAQRLFENCFRVMDGPDAPELTIIEEDQKLTIHIWNKPTSNNYLERYSQRDPFIVCPESKPDCNPIYRFEGYQVWQLKDERVDPSSVLNHDESSARLVYQTDIQNGVGRIINYYWEPDTRSYDAVVEVIGTDKGIRHCFEITADRFAGGEKNLVNYKNYHYVAIAYAHNDYLTYDPLSPEAVEGQKQAYLAGRKGANGTIRVFSGTPHKMESLGLQLVGENLTGQFIQVTQIEGFGNAGHNTDITGATMNAIMDGLPWKAETLTFESERSPVSVTIVDPLNNKRDLYTLKFDSVEAFTSPFFMDGKIYNATWFMVNTLGDTVFSENQITTVHEQLIPQWGLAVKIHQAGASFESGTLNNGFIEATMSFNAPQKPWLTFIRDRDQDSPENWILSGSNDGDKLDPASDFEKILNGGWAPYRLSGTQYHGPAYSLAVRAIDIRKHRLSSVDLYITGDRSRWSRSPVIETTADSRLSADYVSKFSLRSGLSIDKTGRQATPGSGISVREEDPHYISETGMGWFPGFAIDVETGERLNIVYGESSFLTGENGADMAWNPTARRGSKLYEAQNGLGANYTDVLFGGKHFLYIMGHNRTLPNLKDPTYFPAYDAGAHFMDVIHSREDNRIKGLFAHAMWTAIPLTDSTFINTKGDSPDLYSFLPAADTSLNVKIRLRVSNGYHRGAYDFAKPDSLALNDNNPMYLINTRDAAQYRNCRMVKVNALDQIRAVPNPYYGSRGYETSGSGQYIKITNLPERCTVSIFSLNGNLVRRFTKENSHTFIDWDLKNQYGIPIASGAYIIYVDAPGIGNKVVKFFGAIRPKD